MPRTKTISIVGAGLVGSLMSIYLAKRGYKVTIFEKRNDMRKMGAEGGRSINLALSNRGWAPLKEIGIDNEVKSMIIPMRGRMMHDEEGFLTFQPYGREGQAINSISRGGLNELLMNTAEKEGVEIKFEQTCLGINFDESLLFLDDNGSRKEVKSDVIIGGDGAFSVVRRLMQRTDRFNYSQHFIEHGYKELTIPPGAGGSFGLEKHALHIWPRGQYMLIALPNKEGSFTCTLFFPFDGDPSFSSLKTDEDIQQFFEKVFPDTIRLMPTLLKDYHSNPTSSLVTIKCFPWVKNKTVLLGDASHAIVPFYGQGMNSGFEDCRVLNQMLEEHNDDWDKVLPLFQESRKPDADAISDLALQNFIEMRDLVADEDFLLRKKIEAKLHDQYPKQWIPLYSMVTFNENMRYSEALHRGNMQKEIMDKVMSQPDIHKNWEKLDLNPLVEELNTKINS
ncbi:FAD-dependent monooxygenase [Fulvivirga sp. RKSG066]|uniref:FAD-dependent oxidoreductase n=1 Tax=Fulvivirga aurantia TaxID=2529383 RepID=UPI0012BB688E|nr:NAD(P)/FAD-dependent oxidoreductase [Fulvivirga aurantia]MTI22625.1 FAD-dependent monooxygenase [Fulvivirga aurantia]